MPSPAALSNAAADRTPAWSRRILAGVPTGAILRSVIGILIGYATTQPANPVPVLTCRRVVYYSPGDEALFFAWLDRIKVIRRWEGRGDEVLLHVPTRVSAVGHRELTALFRRYRINSRQLAQLSHGRNPAVRPSPDLPAGAMDRPHLARVGRTRVGRRGAGH